MSSEFAFGTSTATHSASKILRVRSEIADTLDAIDSALSSLRPQWTASEADGYQDVMQQWHQGASAIRDILNDVSNSLSQINSANSELRGGISQLLNEIN